MDSATAEIQANSELLWNEDTSYSANRVTSLLEGVSNFLSKVKPPYTVSPSGGGSVGNTGSGNNSVIFGQSYSSLLVIGGIVAALFIVVKLAK